MKNLNDFAIPFVGLSNKVHQFDYNIDKTFFDFFENTLILECEVNVKIDFDKKASFFELTFYIDGVVSVECDRCLEPFKQAIYDDYNLVIKFDENAEQKEEESDVAFIKPNETHLDVSKYIYDFVHLSLPIQKVHQNIEDCNQDIIEKINNKNKTENTDPRWDILNKLKNN